MLTNQEVAMVIAILILTFVGILVVLIAYSDDTYEVIPICEPKPPTIVDEPTHKSA